MNPYAIIAAIVVALAMGTGGYFKGRADANTTWELKAADQAEKARQREIALQRSANEITDKLQTERDRIAGQLDDAIEQLRRRPSRLPDAARTDCKGTTGAELSAEDGQFLAREAARADRIQSALSACYRWADTILGK